MTTMLRPVAGEPGIREPFYDIGTIAIDLGISAARVKHLVESGKLELVSGGGEDLVSAASSHRVAREMVEELSKWRHEDASAERTAAQKKQRLEDEKSPYELESDRRAVLVTQRAAEPGERSSYPFELMNDEDILFRTRKKLALVANVAWKILAEENISVSNSEAFEAACEEVEDLRAMVDEIDERIQHEEFGSKRKRRHGGRKQATHAAVAA